MNKVNDKKLFGIPDFESFDCDDNCKKVLTELLEWIKIKDPTIWDNSDELEVEVEIIYEDI